MTTTTALQAPQLRGDKLEVASIGALVGFLAASQLSVAPAYIMLAITLACWAMVVRVHHERVRVPAMFWLLAAYAGATLVSALNSADPAQSLIDCKQLVLFLIVPVVYRFARGPWAPVFASIIITVGAIGAVIGIAQYGVLHYDNLGKRPQGTLSHYMTYSGVLMLVACAAAARLLYRKDAIGPGSGGRLWTALVTLSGDRLWTALVMPALMVALALTFTRSAWIGTCAGVALLFVLKDRRLLAALPVAVALLIVMAPAGVTQRMYSMFDVNDPSNRDRIAMLQSGVEMVRDHPLTGVGPDMVKAVYQDYRQPWAVNDLNVHLHNVPMHIAAERGLPALLVWLAFIAYVARDLYRRLQHSRAPSLAAAGLAAIAAMVSAGLFEYNFGDSEFLMLFLVLITLPYAADRSPDGADA